MTKQAANEELGAIICGHVARDGLPILCAVRDEPQDPADSGWQFLCYSGKDESVEDAQIWSLRQIIQREPSLKPLLDAKVGTRLVRKNQMSPWDIQGTESKSNPAGLGDQPASVTNRSRRPWWKFWA